MNYHIRLIALLASLFTFTNLYAGAVCSKLLVPDRILVYQDANLQHTAEEIFWMPADSGEYYPANKLHFDFFNSAIWCVFKLYNHSEYPTDRYILINDADFFSLELFSYLDNIQSDYFIDGKKIPFSQKQINHSTPIFKINIPPHAEKTCLLKIHKLGGGVTSPFEIASSDDFSLKIHKKSSLSQIYYSMLFVIIIFNVFILIIMRNQVFLKYLLYVLFSVISVCGMSGFATEYLYPEFTWLSIRDIVSFKILGTIFFLLFIKDFLNIRTKKPTLDLIFNVLLVFHAIAFIVSLFPPFYIGIASLLSEISFLLSILLVVTTSVIYLKDNFNTALIILISYIPFVSSEVLTFLQNIAIIDYTDTVMGLAFPLTFQTFTLTIAIVERLKHSETDKKRIIKETNSMLSKLNLVARKTDNAIAIFSRLGELEWCNKGYENIMQLNTDELTALLGPHITNISLNPDIGEYFRQATETGNSIIYETEFIGSAGDKRWMQTTLTPITDEHGALINYITVDTDLTSLKHNEDEKNRLQEQLLQSQKKESIGRLAEGIAHDFNNILTPIIGYTDMILQDLPDNSEIKEDLTIVFNSAHRARKLVAQILIFSRNFKEDTHPVAVRESVEDVLALLASSLPKNVEISFENNAQNDTILADMAHIQQIVLILCTNAFQAITPNYGKVHLSIENITVETAKAGLQLSRLNPGEYLHIAVEDNGHGMDKRTLERLCEPFFTTKEIGESTGLGLSVVHGIVIKYQGALYFDSALETGTVAHVYLPTCSDEIIKEYCAKTEESATHNSNNFASILIVDDELNVANMLGRILDKQGFSTHCYTDSSTALSEYKLAPSKFDLVITDQTMPQMSGTELAGEMLKLNPAAKIIILTGYSEMLNAELAHSIGIKALLYKPINVQVLLAKILEHIRGDN